MPAPCRQCGAARAICSSAPHRFIVDLLELSDALADALKVQGYPTAQWRMATGGHRHETAPSMQVAQLAFTPSPNAALEELFLAAQAKQWGAGLDPVATSADYWCPMNGDADFGTRANADARIGAAAIADLRGNDVNVVLVDRGLDMTRLPPGSFGGGWAFTPGPSGGSTLHARPVHPAGSDCPARQRTRRGRGARATTARNILALAGHPPVRLADHSAAHPEHPDVRCIGARSVLAGAERYRLAAHAARPGRSVGYRQLLALFDRRSDLLSGTGSFGADPNHPFRAAVQGLMADGADVVFVAGNCGQYCPDDRCGPRDVGPGYSIHRGKCLPGGAHCRGGSGGWVAARLFLARTGTDRVGQTGSVRAQQFHRDVRSRSAQHRDIGGLRGGVPRVVAALRTRTATSTSAATPAAMITALRAARR